MKAIVLTRGRIATVDDEDFDRVNQHKGYARRKGSQYYGARSVILSDGRRIQERLHQFLLGVRGIDHQDGDGLNNRRGNLRRATQTQNMRGSRRKAHGATSQYRGVSWYSPSQKWRAKLKTGGQQIHLGHFDSETDAALAYDAAARLLFGDFASPNFP